MITEQTMAEVKAFVEAYKTQDNACTRQPILYQLQEKERMPTWHDEGDFFYYDGPNCESIEPEDIQQHLADYEDKTIEEIEELDEFDLEHLIEEKDIYKLYYREEWKPIREFFTLKGLQAHLAQNKHNYGETRTYVVHAYRSPEHLMIVKAMFELAGVEWEKLS